jgi:hypothetical protein
MRRAARRDAGQDEIVDALLLVGATVDYWGEDGAPDLVVGFQDKTFLLEVKAPEGTRGGHSRDGQQLNELQRKWHQRWRGHVAVVRTPFGALVAIGAVKAEGGQNA